MRRLCVAVLIAATVPFGVPAQAAPEQTITFTVDPVAIAAADGTSLAVDVTVSCPANYQVLEAFVYVTQGGVQSTFVGIPLTCRPKGQRYPLTIPAPEGQAWVEGPATLSGYVLLVRKAETLSTSAGAPLQIVIP
jgi:hypothetical protein